MLLLGRFGIVLSVPARSGDQQCMHLTQQAVEGESHPLPCADQEHQLDRRRRPKRG